jgi:hypothetical protein
MIPRSEISQQTDKQAQKLLALGIGKMYMHMLTTIPVRSGAAIGAARPLGQYVRDRLKRTKISDPDMVSESGELTLMRDARGRWERRHSSNAVAKRQPKGHFSNTAVAKGASQTTIKIIRSSGKVGFAVRADLPHFVLNDFTNNKQEGGGVQADMPWNSLLEGLKAANIYMAERQAEVFKIDLAGLITYRPYKSPGKVTTKKGILDVKTGMYIN